jgi:hypothetical protein
VVLGLAEGHVGAQTGNCFDLETIDRQPEVESLRIPKLGKAHDDSSAENRHAGKACGSRPRCIQ